jgi:tripartite-type tricarboxylate transporter receptor subunit TctC
MLFFLAVFIAGAAMAQSYPAKPIRLVVPLVPGGNQDIVARAIAEEMSKSLGQQVVVENRPGQSAIIGTQAGEELAARRLHAPVGGRHLRARAGVVKAAGYDPRSDFHGVSLVCRIPQVLVVNREPARARPCRS